MWKHRGFVGKVHRFMVIQRSGVRLPHVYFDDDIGLFWWRWFVRALGAKMHQWMHTAYNSASIDSDSLA